MAAEREGLAEQRIFLYPPVLRWWRDRGAVIISPFGKRCSSGPNPGILGSAYVCGEVVLGESSVAPD